MIDIILNLLTDSAFLASIPRFVTPLLLAALGGALCERAGVFNIALEGFILVGAFAAVIGSFASGSSLVGIFCACLGGVLMGLLFAEFSVRQRADAIVVSVALNLLALGLTTFLLRAVIGVSGAFRDPAIVGIDSVTVPGLSQLPFVGPLFTTQSPLFIVALLCVPLLQFMLLRHRFGLRLRAAGEEPDALLAGGVSVTRIRTLALMACGVLCGLAGAQLSISNVNLFVENMSAGRGWIAVVAVLLTRGRPWPLLCIAILFGFTDSLSFRFQGLGLPQQFTDAMPYLMTLLVLVGSSLWIRRRTGAGHRG